MKSEFMLHKNLSEIRTDILTKQERSRRMQLIHSRDTKPELVVRRHIKEMGLRFHTHSAKLPGKPDLVFSSAKKVIFIHGCFWHRHEKCRRAQTPKSHETYWKEKFIKNIERDLKNQAELKQKGWQSLVLWECEITKADRLMKKLNRFLIPSLKTL